MRSGWICSIVKTIGWSERERCWRKVFHISTPALLLSCFFRNEQPSVSLVRPPVGWHRNCRAADAEDDGRDLVASGRVSVRRASFKGPSRVQLYWREFESRRREKILLHPGHLVSLKQECLSFPWPTSSLNFLGGGQHSTVVAFALHTQLSRVPIWLLEKSNQEEKCFFREPAVLKLFGVSALGKAQKNH